MVQTRQVSADIFSLFARCLFVVVIGSFVRCLFVVCSVFARCFLQRNKRKRTVDSDERGGQKERRIKGKKVQEKLEKINVKG